MTTKALQKKTAAISKSSSVEDEEKKALLAEFLRQVCLVANRPVSKELAECYWAQIKSFPTRQIAKGLDECLATTDKWPWPSEVASYIEEAI